jgi:hypothetical protein
VVETLGESGQVRITLQAVKNYFRGNLEVQKERVARQIANAEELLGTIGHPETAEGQLARAAFLAGYMGLDRDKARLGPRDAEFNRLQRANLALRKRYLILKQQRSVQEKQERNVRIGKELARWRLVRAQIKKIREGLKSACENRVLDEETHQKIREIYGLVSQPIVPKMLEGALAPITPEELLDEESTQEDNS